MRVTLASIDKSCAYCGEAIRRGEQQVLVTGVPTTRLVAAHPTCREKVIQHFMNNHTKDSDKSQCYELPEE